MIEELGALANAIRWKSLAAIYTAGSGHPGGALSAAELLAYICLGRLEWRKGATDTNSRFVLSKGHACPALYAAAADCQIISHQTLRGFRKLGSALQGHPNVLTTPWVETSTGSLGQGFSFALGMALGYRHQGTPQRTYVLLGDGELQEGQVWEAAMCAGHYKLDRLCVLIDYNKMQSDDWNENILGIEPLVDKWTAFRWQVIEIDGHDFAQIAAAVEQADHTADKPSVVIAHTTKGKGVSFMEGSPAWHGSVKLRDQELVDALSELGLETEKIESTLNGTIWG